MLFLFCEENKIKTNTQCSYSAELLSIHGLKVVLTDT